MTLWILVDSSRSMIDEERISQYTQWMNMNVEQTEICNESIYESRRTDLFSDSIGMLNSSVEHAGICSESVYKHRRTNSFFDSLSEYIRALNSSVEQSGICSESVYKHRRTDSLSDLISEYIIGALNPIKSANIDLFTMRQKENSAFTFNNLLRKAVEEILLMEIEEDGFNGFNLPWEENRMYSSVLFSNFNNKGFQYSYVYDRRRFLKEKNTNLIYGSFIRINRREHRERLVNYQYRYKDLMGSSLNHFLSHTILSANENLLVA